MSNTSINYNKQYIQDKVKHIDYDTKEWKTCPTLKIKSVWGEYWNDKENRQIWVDFEYKGVEFIRCISLDKYLEQEVKETKEYEKNYNNNN
jgi:hypothetical protein